MKKWMNADDKVDEIGRNGLKNGWMMGETNEKVD